MKIQFSKHQTMQNCISLEPENRREKQDLREIVNALHNENLLFESFSVNNKIVAVNLPMARVKI